MLVSGGEVNTERTAIMLVDEFRACKWGRISLEAPPVRAAAEEEPDDADENYDANDDFLNTDMFTNPQ